MKKGEMRKDSIRKTAEKLFFEKGYEETSIQDILDALSISKGGFYHYFDSKIALLEEICNARALEHIERLQAELYSQKLSPIGKLNLLLSAVNLFMREEPAFCALFLKISYLEHDVNFREHTRDFMLDRLRPLVDETVREGMADDSLFSRNPAQIGRLLLMLAYDVNDEACRILTENAEDADCVIAIMDLLNAYRESVETLTGAACGSIQLFELGPLMHAFRETAKQLNLIKGDMGE